MREEELIKTLFFIGNNLKGSNDFDCFKPVNARFANQLAETALLVAEGKDLEQAIEEVKKMQL